MILAVLLLAAASVTNSTAKIENPAQITSDTTYYDRKEGIAVFKGHVHVDDSEYQMHADRAFLYMDGTNSLSKIAAIGKVALTNGLRRAYGEKATYYREKGLVVLTGSEKNPAIVTEATPDGDRTVQGTRIRFWIDREQVEVLGTVISAPKTGNAKDLPSLLHNK